MSRPQPAQWSWVAFVVCLTPTVWFSLAERGRSDPPSGTAAIASRELHMIGIYEGSTRTDQQIHGGKASVVVNRPGKRVTLFLSSYDPVTWDVTVKNQTQIEHVILGGYHQQAVTGVPAGAKITEAFYERRAGGGKVLYGGHELESPRLRGVLREVVTLTGLELSSFQGAYRAEQPLLIDHVQENPRLSSQYPKPAPRESLPQVSFAAVHYAAQGRFPHESAALWGEFTLDGPRLESLRRLPQNIVRLAYDPRAKQYYGLGNHEVYEVDLEANTAKPMDMGLNVPRLSWPCGIAFDSERHRLLVASLGGEGFLYAYSTQTKQWSVLASMNNVDCSALVYHAAYDTLYALGQPHGETAFPQLHRFNVQGQVVSTIEIGPPMLPGVVGHAPGGARVQLVSADKHLALLLYPNSRGSEGPADPTVRIFLIEPSAGTATLAWAGDVATLIPPAQPVPAATARPPQRGLVSHGPLPAEFGSLAGVLKVQRVAGQFRLARPEQQVRLRIDLYHEGQKVAAPEIGVGCSTSADQASDGGQYVLHVIDLDHLPLGEGKPGHSRLHIQLLAGGSQAASSVDLPKARFDASRTASQGYFAPVEGQAALFYLVGGSSTVSSGHTVEQVLKANPQADVLIGSLEFGQ